MRIAVGIYEEVKPSDTLKVISDDGVSLILLNNKSLGTRAVIITSKSGRVYAVYRQAVTDDKRQELHHNS